MIASPWELVHFTDQRLTPDRRQSKTLILSTNVNKKLLETGFSIVICRQTGDKW